MPRTTGAARIARPAAAVDLSDNGSPCERPTERGSDEFVSEHSAKTLIASDQLQIRGADARPEHADHHLPGGRDGVGTFRLQPHAIVFEHQCTHLDRIDRRGQLILPSR